MEMRRYMGTEEDGEPFRIWVSFDSRETTLSNKPPKHCTIWRGAITSAVLLRKMRTIPYGSVPPSGSKSNKRRLTSPDLKAKVVRLGHEWQVSSRSTLPGLLADKMIRQQISLTNKLVHQSTTPTKKRRHWRTRAGHRRPESGPSLMRELEIHKSIHVSVTNWRLASEYVSLAPTCQPTNFSQLTRDRWRVHRRWASCLRPKTRLHRSLNQGLSMFRTRMTLAGT